MNKTDFIAALAQATGWDHQRCAAVNRIGEEYFILAKSNKEKIISAISEQCAISREEATRGYEAAMTILDTEIKNKMRHPWGR